MRYLHGAALRAAASVLALASAAHLGCDTGDGPRAPVGDAMCDTSADAWQADGCSGGAAATANPAQPGLQAALPKLLSWKDYACDDKVLRPGEVRLVASLELNVRRYLPDACRGTASNIAAYGARIWPTEDGFFALHRVAGGKTTSYGVLGFYRANGWAVARQAGSCPPSQVCCSPETFQQESGTTDLVDAIVHEADPGEQAMRLASPLSGNRLLVCVRTALPPGYLRCDVRSASLSKLQEFSLPSAVQGPNLVVLPGDRLAVLGNLPQTVSGGNDIQIYDFTGQLVSKTQLLALAGLEEASPKYYWSGTIAGYLQFGSRSMAATADGNLEVTLGRWPGSPSADSNQLAGLGIIDLATATPRVAYLPRSNPNFAWGSPASKTTAPGGELLASGPASSQSPWLWAGTVLARPILGQAVRGPFATAAPVLVMGPLRKDALEPSSRTKTTFSAAPFFSFPVAAGANLLVAPTRGCAASSSGACLDFGRVAVYCIRTTSQVLGI